MKNEVYGTVELVVSVDVESETEELALLEANYKYNEMRLADCWLHGIDMNGNVHKFNVHDFKINLVEFMD